MIDTLVNASNHAAIAVEVAICPPLLVSAVAAVGGGVIVHYLEHAVTDTVTSWQNVGWAFVVFSFMSSSRFFSSRSTSLEHVAGQIRVQARFYPCNDPETARLAYREAREIVRRAKDGETEIYVLNSFVNTFQAFEPDVEVKRGRNT